MKRFKSAMPEGMPLVGVSSLDSQHLEIDGLCGAIEEAIRARVRVDLLIAHYDGLRSAVGHHFLVEEALVDRLPDSLRVPHRAEHERLLEMIGRVRNRLGDGDRHKWLWRHHVFVGELAQHYARFDRTLGDLLRVQGT